MDDGFTKQELGIVNPFLFMTPTVSIASTTKFPSKVRDLDRASLEERVSCACEAVIGDAMKGHD